MLNKNIVTFIGCESEYEDAKIVLYGAPFDSTTSFRPGTRFGSAAIRNESFGLETYSPYQDKELTEYCVFDSGDLELPMGGGCLIWHRLYQLFLDLFYEGLENGFKTLQKEDRT